MTPAETASISPTPSPAPPAGAGRGPCLASTAFPMTPAGPVTVAPIWVLMSGLATPDDILFHEGVLYVGELGSGHIALVEAGRPDARLGVVVPRVEGLQYLGGRLYAADQQNDRVDVVDGSVVTTFLQLTPVAGQDGVDGIGLAGDQLLIPDSANHQLLWVSASGAIQRRVGGFNRPTGAWALGDGSVLVADEYGNAVYRIAPDGGRTALVTGLPIVDDVAADSDGRVFVVTPVTSGGRLAEIVGGKAIDLVGNLLEPQGIDFDGAGNIFVSEAAAGRVDLVIRYFKIVPAGIARPAPGEPLCIDVIRAPSFQSSIELAGGPGVTIASQPGLGTRGSVVLGDCGQRYCRVRAMSGGRSDELWIDTTPGG